MVSVAVYVADLPSQARLKIYSGVNNGEPGNLIFEQAVTFDLNAYDWSELILDRPVLIENNSYWVSLAFTQTRDQRTIGCDVGPGTPNGDWHYEDADGNWMSFLLRTNAEADINWNIRVKTE